MRPRPFPVLALVAEGVASAIDAIHANARRSGLAMAVVGASVCAVLVTGAASRGIAARVARDAAADGARGFTVYPRPAIHGGRSLGSADARALAALPQIAGAAAHRMVVLPVSAGDRVPAAATIDAYDGAGPALYDADLLRGRSFTAADASRAAPVVVISDALAARLAPTDGALGAEIEIRHRPFHVIGIYHAPAPGLRAVMPLETAERVLGVAPAWTDVFVHARRGVPLAEAMRAATAALRRTRGLTDTERADFVVAGADGLRAGTRAVPVLSGIATVGLAAIGLTVGGIALLGLMMRSVDERTREIGLRKVLGATRAAIVVQILIESTTLAALGGAAGLAAGRAIAMLLADGMPIPASVSAAAALTAIAVTILGGAVLGAPPALRAAKLDILHALRDQ